MLVVDDNADAADLLGERLRAAGHEVTVAHHPESALRAAPAFQPQVAVLDIGLPEMDGYALGVRLKKILGERSCRLFALSGYGQEADRARTAAAGFEAHLVKPVDTRKLLHSIATPAE